MFAKAQNHVLKKKKKKKKKKTDMLMCVKVVSLNNFKLFK